MKKLHCAALAAAAALGLGACATTPVAPDAPAPAEHSEFPTQDQLTELHATPLPQSALDLDGTPVERWELAGPLPERFGSAPFADASPSGQALAAYAATRNGLLQTPEDMHCVARELGRFVLARGAAPTQELRDFIAGRCGAVATQISMFWISGEFAPQTGEDKILAQTLAQNPDLFARSTGAGERSAGIWFGRDGKKTLTFIASGIRRVNLETTARVPDAQQHVVLRGELLIPADHVQSAVTQGTYGFGPCVPDPAVALPRFAISCSLLPEDAEARIELAGFPPGRVIGPIAVDVTAWPQGKGSLVFTRSEIAKSAVPEGPLADAVLARINAVRTQAELSPLRLAQRESTTSGQLAPYYFAAMAGRVEATLADRVSLGLRAGWEVDGEIRSADFAAAVLEQSHDPARLANAALASPFGRAVLLGRDARQLAVGTVALGQGGMGAVFTSYAMFDDAITAGAARELFARVSKERAARNLPAPRAISGLDTAAQRADELLRAGSYTPDTALQSIFLSGRDHGLELRGAWMLAPNLDFAVPQQLLQPGPLQLFVAVSRQKTPGHPWARYVVLFAFPRGDTLALLEPR